MRLSIAVFFILMKLFMTGRSANRERLEAYSKIF